MGFGRVQRWRALHRPRLGARDTGGDCRGCFVPEQQVWRGTMARLASERRGWRATCAASIVVGDVAALALYRPQTARHGDERSRGCRRSVTEGTEMSSPEKPSTHGRTRLSFASVADIDEFVATLERYERGELTPDQWRAFRLVRGNVRTASGRRRPDVARQDAAGHPHQRTARLRLPTSASAIRGASATSPRGRTSSFISSSFTTSSQPCADWPRPA